MYLEVGRRTIILCLKDGDFPNPYLKDESPELGSRTPLEYLETMASSYKADIIQVTKEDLAIRLPSLLRTLYRRSWQLASDMAAFYLQSCLTMAESGSGPVVKDALRNFSWAFNNQEFSDIRLDVVDSSGTKSIFAHKSLLYARSSTFREILLKNPTISVLEIKGTLGTELPRQLLLNPCSM
jgi:hypothetical protein